MLKNLFKIKETRDWQEDMLWVQCVHPSHGDCSLSLTVNILYTCSTNLLESWRIDCKKVRAFKESPKEFMNFKGLPEECLGFVESHPLLLPYFVEETTLSFLGKPKNVDAAVGGLLKAHYEIVGDAFELGKFLNAGVKPWDLLAGGFGQIAVGPLPLMEAYARVLELNGVEPNISKPYKPSWHGSNGWIEEKGNVKLLMLGRGYVIAEKFKATKIK